MFSHSFSFCFARIAAARVGFLACAHSSFWPIAYFSVFVSSPGFVDEVFLSLTSKHCKGRKRFSGPFNNFPDAVRTVADRTSFSLLGRSFSMIPNFQVPLGKLYVRSPSCSFQMVLSLFAHTALVSGRLYGGLP